MVLEALLGGIFTVIGNFFNILGDFLTALFNFLLFLPMVLILIGVMLIAFFAEIVFKKMAGIDTIYLGNTAFGGANDGGQDLVYAFITEPAVQDVFWSIVALSFVLLFIFTLVAIIKSEFTLDLKGSAKGPIIARAFKSFANFIIIPVVTLISVIGTNYLTKTVYDLFGTTGDSVVTKCFYLGAYNANRARLSPIFANQLAKNEDFDGDEIYDKSNPFTGKSQDQVAFMIDQYFLNGTTDVVEFVKPEETFFSRVLNCGKDALDSGYINFALIFFGYPSSGDFSMVRPASINYYYDLTQFDWILAIGSAICMAWILLTTCLVLVKRVFELTILFLLAPVMTAIAPLDGGQAEKKWRQEFMKRLLAVIGPIFAFNMYFLLVPLFTSISLFGSSGFIAPAVANGGTMLNSILLILAGFYLIFDIFFQIVCVITGMSIVKSASALLSNLLGIEDLVKAGGETAKKAVGTGVKAFAGAAAIAMPAVKGAAALMKTGKGMFNKAGRLQKREDKAKGKLDSAKEAAEANPNSEVAKLNLEEAQAAYDEAQSKNKEYTDKKAGKAFKREEKRLTKKQGKMQAKIKQLKEDQEYDKSVLTPDGTPMTESGQDIERSLKRRMAKRADKIAGLEKLYTSPEGITAAAGAKSKEKREKLKKKAESYSFLDLGGNIKNEFGKDSGENSVFAKTFNSKAYKKIFGNGRFAAMDTMLKGLFTPDTEKNDGKTGYKRRLNDALSGLFGENGGGELWKIWFNKNSRAGLFENVPEAKKRSEGIQQSLSWAARANWEKSNEAKKRQDAEEQNIRRMIAEEKGSKEYLRMINERDQAAADKNEAKVEKLDADIKKFEAKSGLRAEGEAFYNALKSGDRSKQKQLAEFKDRMKHEADYASHAAEVKKKEDAQKIEKEYNSVQEGAKQNVKMDSESSKKQAEEFAKKLKDELDKAKLKIDENTINKLAEAYVSNGSGGQDSQIATVLQRLLEAIEKMEGKK